MKKLLFSLAFLLFFINTSAQEEWENVGSLTSFGGANSTDLNFDSDGNPILAFNSYNTNLHVVKY